MSRDVEFDEEGTQNWNIEEEHHDFIPLLDEEERPKKMKKYKDQLPPLSSQ